jgi:polygalacturonase
MQSDNSVSAGDYTTIQKAVDALPPEGGTVFIPAGIYKISEPIVVKKSEVSLMGAGSGIYILGEKNGYINITGNTIKRPSYNNPGIYSGIINQNTSYSINI